MTAGIPALTDLKLAKIRMMGGRLTILQMLTYWPVRDQDLIDWLRETRGLHRQAIRAINQYINQAKATLASLLQPGSSRSFPDDNNEG